MLSHPIPNNLRGADPTIPKEVLESKLKVIVQRRAEIEALLSRGAGDSYEEQELKAERQALERIPVM